MNDVSRETDSVGDVTPTPSVPAEARRVFASERLPLMSAYAELLATDGVVRGLIGPREAPRLWDRHLINCGLLAEQIPPDVTVCDIGSGAGLPGLVLAIARPDLQVALVEPLLRRTTFLEEVAERLDLSNVEVHRGKADTWHGTRTFDVVTSRAVAPLGRLLEWSMPLVSPHGRLLAMKGSSIDQEIVDAADVIERLRCAPPVVRRLGDDVSSPTMAVQVVHADPLQVSLPLARKTSAGRKAAGPRARNRKQSKRRHGA